MQDDDLFEELTTYAILSALRCEEEGAPVDPRDRDTLINAWTPENLIRFARGCALNQRDVLPNLEAFARAYSIVTEGNR